MKKRKAILLLMLCIFLFTACGEDSDDEEEEGTKPFAELTVEDITSVSLEYNHGGDRHFYILNETQTEKFVSILNGFIIYDENERWNETSGGSDIYTITKADGTETVVILITPCVGIDYKGYNAKGNSCDKLQLFAERIVDGRL